MTTSEQKYWKGSFKSTVHGFVSRGTVKALLWDESYEKEYTTKVKIKYWGVYRFGQRQTVTARVLKNKITYEINNTIEDKKEEEEDDVLDKEIDDDDGKITDSYIPTNEPESGSIVFEITERTPTEIKGTYILKNPKPVDNGKFVLKVKNNKSIIQNVKNYFSSWFH